jgi:hypothetical protein
MYVYWNTDKCDRDPHGGREEIDDKIDLEALRGHADPST